ncbi:MAG: hypothetical protein ACXU9B_10275 [Reyranella sp.]
MIRLIVAASLGVALIASSAEAAVYCNADGTPQGCVWEPNGIGASGVGVYPGVGAGAVGVGVTPGVGVGARGVGVEPGAGVGRDGAGFGRDDGEMNRGGPVNRAGRR